MLTHIIPIRDNVQAVSSERRAIILQRGERKTVTLFIGREVPTYYDDMARTWVAEARNFEVLVGASAQDIRTTATFVQTDSSRWL